MGFYRWRIRCMMPWLKCDASAAWAASVSGSAARAGRKRKLLRHGHLSFSCVQPISSTLAVCLPVEAMHIPPFNTFGETPWSALAALSPSPLAPMWRSSAGTPTTTNRRAPPHW